MFAAASMWARENKTNDGVNWTSKSETEILSFVTLIKKAWMFLFQMCTKYWNCTKWYRYLHQIFYSHELIWKFRGTGINSNRIKIKWKRTSFESFKIVWLPIAWPIRFECQLQSGLRQTNGFISIVRCFLRFRVIVIIMMTSTHTHTHIVLLYWMCTLWNDQLKRWLITSSHGLAI